jgi:uncharacterized protein YyaL (SSP411 family)
MLSAIDFYVGPSKEVALVGPPESFLSILRKRYLPRVVVAAGDERVALLSNRPMVKDQPTAYICENFTCKQPVTNAAEFERQL